jgi:hypothetical protein
VTAAPLAARYARWHRGHPRTRMEDVPAEVTRRRAVL